MRKNIWHNKWFYLIAVITLFIMATSVKVAYAGTDTQLDKVLKAGTDGFTAYLNFLIDVLKEVW